MIKAIPAKPREERTIIQARAFLLKMRINWLPVDPFEITKKCGWETLTAGKVSKMSGVPINKVLNGKDSDVWCFKDKYKIVYNDQSHPPRIPFTIGHEIGHIVLNHLIDFEQTRMSRGGLTYKEYDVLEREAEIFAAELLMPMPILMAKNIYKATEIKKICRVSPSAADYRKKDIKKWGQSYPKGTWFSNGICNMFAAYLDKIRICNNCGNSGIGINARYCTVCGKAYIGNMKGVISVKYDGYKLDDKGHALECPICGNEEYRESKHHTEYRQYGPAEEIETLAQYCRICGYAVVNRCTASNCGEIADGNARYCEFCASPTTFYEGSYLNPWNDMKDKLGEKAAANQIAASQDTWESLDRDIKLEDIDINPDEEEIPF